MDIEMDVGIWFELNEDKDGNIIIEMPFDNNGNGLRLVVKESTRRFFKELINDGFKLLTKKEQDKIINKLKSKNEVK